MTSVDDRVRGEGVYELGTLGPEGAGSVARLASMYGVDRNLDVRWSAAWAIGRMGRGGLDAVPALLRGLRLDPDPDVRGITAWALGQLAPIAREWESSVIDAACHALSDHDSLVREEAVSALGKFGAQAARVLPEIAARTADKHRLVRRRALEAVARISSVPGPT